MRARRHTHNSLVFNLCVPQEGRAHILDEALKEVGKMLMENLYSKFKEMERAKKMFSMLSSFDGSNVERSLAAGGPSTEKCPT